MERANPVAGMCEESLKRTSETCEARQGPIMGSPTESNSFPLCGRANIRPQSSWGPVELTNTTHILI